MTGTPARRVLQATLPALVGRRRRWTLAGRLSLLFLVVLLLVVTAFGAVAYGEARNMALERASERMSNTARELAASSVRLAAPRNVALQALARRPEVVAVLRHADRRSAGELVDVAVQQEISPTPTARVDAEQRAIEQLYTARRQRGDTAAIGWAIWSANGTRLLGSHPLSPRDSVVLRATAREVLAHDSIARSQIYGVGNEVHVWTAVPVRRADTTLGVLAERRRIAGSPQTEALIRRLTGQDARVFIAAVNGTEWSSVLGRATTPVASPAVLESATDTTAVRMTDTNGEALYITAATVSGTPWRIVITQTEAAIMARPSALLKRLIGVGLLLLTAGTWAAWWLTRGEVRPLHTLRAATDAMAQGDYSQVVTPDGAEETAALADAFNSMSRRISGAHATLEAQNAQLQQANEAKARFLAVMSHELRTPLNAIGGYAELVALGVQGPTNETQRESLSRIMRSKDQLLHLVGDILHYARLDSAPLVVGHEPVLLRQQFAALRDTTQEQFTRKGVALSCDDGGAAVWGDPARVQQVLLNLTINALQFTDTGGAVTLTVHSEEKWTTLHVRDTGTGIPAEQQATIFEPFVQGDSSLTRRVGGAGLGLAIVRQLTDAMGGSVSVTSVVGEGSTFAVTLPTAVMTAELLQDSTAAWAAVVAPAE